MQSQEEIIIVISDSSDSSISVISDPTQQTTANLSLPEVVDASLSEVTDDSDTEYDQWLARQYELFSNLPICYMQNVIDSAKLNALIEKDIVREFERIYDSLRREEADKEIKLFARRKRATQRRTERMMNNQ